jgi:hypothetical protein
LSITRVKNTGTPSRRKPRAIRGETGALSSGAKRMNAQKHSRRTATGTMNQTCKKKKAEHCKYGISGS